MNIKKEKTALKILRDELGLSQTELANILKMSPSSISKIEKSERPLTDRFVSQISKEFGVNEKWLRTGEGKIFIDSSDDELIAEIAANIINSDDKFMKNVLIAFNKLTKEQRSFLIDFVKELDK
ncbi:TPA: helix-turn-helix transcriptional regulator [Clostridioides difficile]|nr:helix-turn-helix transcriptional regulator [Clostridioides difficile]HBF3423974.1 helix-turn-helix transcriptional regulator [Clostridioides difficile]HBF4770304.1 helix-turn-helix transcriptional regulator [Clostridioides difficile]HBF4983834.1 helix-turn-helix transcriptional regulator [Clostridioides difficile]HBF5346448.1 helix-turn-helix transcriptional regulator [Clostridioides difficile]